MLRYAAWFALLLTWALNALAAVPGEGDVTLQSRYWIDETGQAPIGRVAAGTTPLQPMDQHRAFALGDGALWMRLDLPALDPSHRWYLMLTGAAFINRASLFTRQGDGTWQEQQAGD